MKVLIGVDGSAPSQAAIDWVKTWEWEPGSRFIVVSAARPIVVYASAEVPVPATMLPELIEEPLREARAIVARAERELADAGLEAEARAIEGDPREVLVDTATREGADLMVVGSHGRTGLEKLLIGSVASHVVSHAPCTVIVARKPGPNPRK